MIENFERKNINDSLIEAVRFAANHPPINHYLAKENIWIHINRDIEEGREPLDGGIDELVEPNTFFFMNIPEEKRQWYKDYYNEIKEDIYSIVSIVKGTKTKPDNRLQEFILEHIKR